MPKSSPYKGVHNIRGSRWGAKLYAEGKQYNRGPFPFHGQAVEARRLMVEAKERGEEIPSTTWLKEQDSVKNAPKINGERYLKTMRERTRGRVPLR